MAIFKRKKEIGAESKVFAGNMVRFSKVRKDIEDAIKKNNLSIDLIEEYINVCESVRLQLSNKNSKLELSKENSKLTEDNFQGFINNMTAQITWATNELKLRMDMSSLKMEDVKSSNGNDEEYIRPHIEHDETK